MNRWNVVLAGGVGSRFWPLSTPERPKQLLPLISEAPMLRDTLDRMRPLAPLTQTLVLTNASLRDAVLALEPELPPDNVIAEPRPAGTCAALAWAAQVIAQRAGGDAVMICVHADWAIGDVEAYRATLAEAGRVALEERALVTVGIVPSRPDPGFGYIQPGARTRDGVQRVVRFVEKPDRERAAQMVADGYLWNSGIFAWCVGDLLDEIRVHTPEVHPALTAAGNDLETFFAQVKSVAIDVGVLERSAAVAVVPGTFAWDDIGSWEALARVRPLDPNGNVLVGDVTAVGAKHSIAWSERIPIVLAGVENVVVVEANGRILVMDRRQAGNLKQVLDQLPPAVREIAP